MSPSQSQREPSGPGSLRRLLPWLVGTAIAQVLLFAPYVAGGSTGAAGGEATVLCFSLAFSLLGLASQALVGAACLAVLRRRGLA